MARKPKTRAPYLMVSPQTWELARADYLGGMTAQQVADKYVIGVHNLRAHISEHGWSKRAQLNQPSAATPSDRAPPDGQAPCFDHFCRPGSSVDQGLQGERSGPHRNDSC